MTEQSLRVMTYNAHHGSGNDVCVNPVIQDGELPGPDCALDLPRLARVIETENPDIVGLQELDRFWARSNGIDQPAEVASFLRMDYRFGANLEHGPDIHAAVSHEYGVATLTNFAINHGENHLLPTPDGWETRGMLDVRVALPGFGEVAVINTHLQVGLGGHPEEAKRQRREQAQTIADYIATIELPVIVLGDMNTSPGSGDLESLTGAGALLRDVWVSAGNGEGNTIFHGAVGEPTARIDYILVSRHFRVLNARVVDNESSRMASDHFPLVADLTIVNEAIPQTNPTQPD